MHQCAVYFLYCIPTLIKHYKLKRICEKFSPSNLINYSLNKRVRYAYSLTNDFPLKNQNIPLGVYVSQVVNPWFKRWSQLSQTTRHIAPPAEVEDPIRPFANEHFTKHLQTSVRNEDLELLVWINHAWRMCTEEKQRLIQLV